MKTIIWKLGCASGLLAAACGGTDASVKYSASEPGTPSASAAADEDDDGDDDDEDIAIGALPEAVRNAALAAVPGIVLNRAEKETSKGRAIYSIEGTANGEQYCVEVGTDGTLIGVEQDDDDDDDDDDENDD